MELKVHIKICETAKMILEGFQVLKAYLQEWMAKDKWVE